MKKQQGFTLLSLLATLSIVSVLLVQWARMATDAQKQTKETVAAQHFKQIMDASVKYIQDNYAIIEANATPTAPAIITTAMLINTNKLPASFTGINPYRQAVQVEVLQPTSGNFQAVAISTGGTPIPDVQAPRVATKIGASGGYTPSNNATTAQGSYGGWTMPLTYNTQPGAGHLVGLLYFSNGILVNDYLRRHAVPGHPELTSMYTPLSMKAVATVDTNDSRCPAGDATAIGNIAVDTSGAILTCQGKWKKQGSSYWLDPVASYAALALITTDPVGTVRMTLDTGRSFMWTGTTWKALAVDQNGNLTMTGTMTAGKVQLVDVVVENTACSSNGLQAQDNTGLILSCQSGRWRNAAGEAAAKSWVTFDGTRCGIGYCPIYGSYNVASVSRLDVGTYYVAFKSALPWSGYAIYGTAGGLGGTDPYVKAPADGTQPTVNGFYFYVVNNFVVCGNCLHPPIDEPYISVNIFGNN